MALIVTGGLVYWIAQRIHLDLFIRALEDAHYHYLFFASLCTLTIILLNSWQFKIFLPKFGMVKFSKMIQLISIFSMSVNVLPFWGGHGLLVYLLGQREKVGKTVALSALTLDQITEGFAKLFLFSLVAFSGFLPSWMKVGMQSFILLIVGIYAILFFLAYKFRDHVDEWNDMSGPILGRLSKVFKKWAHHLQVLRNWPSFLMTVALATGMKILEVLAVYFTQVALGVDLGIMAAVVVVAALSLATALPLTPGRLGIFEGAAMLTYQYLGVDPTLGLALGVTIHAVHTLPFIVAGYLSSLKMGFKGVIPKIEAPDPAFEGT